MKLVEGLPSSNRRWKDGYFFVCRDNWEKLPKEGDDFIPFRRMWGVPSSFGVWVYILFLALLLLLLLLLLFLGLSFD